MNDLLIEMLKNKYIESENVINEVKKDFPILRKEINKKGLLISEYLKNPDLLVFNSVKTYILKENKLLIFFTDNSFLFVSNFYIDPLIKECYQLLGSRQKQMFAYSTSRENSLNILDVESDFSSFLKRPFGNRNVISSDNYLVQYCSKLFYSSRRKNLISPTITKRLISLVVNQAENKPFLEEKSKIKLFNKIINNILNDLFYKKIQLNYCSGLSEKKLIQGIFLKKLLSLMTNKEEIIALYVVPAYIKSYKFRKEDFENFLVYFHNYITPRIISEFNSLKKDFPILNIPEINNFILKYGICNITFYKQNNNEVFFDDAAELNLPIKKFLNVSKNENKRRTPSVWNLDLPVNDEVPF